MIQPPVNALLEFTSSPAASVAEFGECFELTIRRDEARLLVTVPKQVLEWFVDATCTATSRTVSDWMDYCGYDDRPEWGLADAMAHDIRTFLRAILDRPLRFREQRGWLKPKFVLEWERAGRWSSAVPFSAED